MDTWQGKSVLITGSATGIGCSTAKQLAEKGAVVYVTGLSEQDCEPVVRSIQEKGGKAYAAKLDVNNSDEFKNLIDRVCEEQGKLDVLINNAGILYVGEFYDMEVPFIEKLIQTNITAVTVGSLHAFQVMKKQGHGLIANVASMGGFSPTPTMAVYAATKHAVLGLTNSLALEAKEFGIEVKAVCFGLIQTELFRTAEMKKGDENTVFGMLPVKPMSPDEAAKHFVEKMPGKKRIIFAPFYARLTWWIYRLFPSLLDKGGLDTINSFRELTSEK